jgi:hypothetical protein
MAIFDGSKGDDYVSNFLGQESCLSAKSGSKEVIKRGIYKESQSEATRVP